MNGYLLDTSTCIFLLRGKRSVKIITFDETIHTFAKERARLWKAGKKIEDFDLLIGCAAKAKDLTIVTHNRRHFEHIEGLQIEDWAV